MLREWLVCFSHKVALVATLVIARGRYLSLCPVQSQYLERDKGEFGGLVPI